MKNTGWPRLFTLLLLSLSWQLQAAAGGETDPFHIEFTSAGDGIWFAYRPESTRQPVVGNGVIIVNGDHLVVVDGNASPLVADRVIAGIRERTRLPVRYLVNTHWHGDHNLGNHRFRDAFPEIEIIGHRFTRDAMLGSPMDYVEEYKSTLAGQLENLAGVLEAGALPDGTAIPAFLLPGWTDLATHRGLISEQMQASVVTPPTRVFEDRMDLSSGARKIVVQHFGNANTRGDAVVWLPGDRLLITGDIVVFPTPYGFGSYPESWVRVLNELIALDPVTIVPGHGPVQTDTAYLELLASLMRWTHSEVQSRVQEGQSLEEIQADLDFGGRSGEFTGGDEWLESRFEAWFATPIIEAAYNEIMGIDNEPLDESAH